MLILFMSSLILKNSNIIDVVTGNISHKDIKINKGVIEEFGSDFISASSNVIDLNGQFVMLMYTQQLLQQILQN